MGALTSRQNAGVEEIDMGTPHAYRYPAKSGNFFGNHFIMGGERFDNPQPEAYLFGENADLNFLGSRPAPFPYTAPQPNEPIKTLKSLMNIRKESVRFVRATDDNVNKVMQSNTQYNIEFTFDSDARCAITVHYFCTDEITPNGVVYTPRDHTMSSETYHYKRGANQQFTQHTHIFDPSKFSELELNYNIEKEVTPIVIQCIAEEGDEPHQQHMLLATVERNCDGTYGLKPLKQKQFVDGLCYLLQELYGIENKNAEYSKHINEDEVEDNGSECVICMCDVRDTLILPCRHLCLCNGCADSLRYQANNCPICRAPFRALLQIRALRRFIGGVPAVGSGVDSQIPDNIPQGYELTSLIEALNGPMLAPTMLPSLLALRPPPLAVLAQDAVTSPSLPTTIELFQARLDCGSSGSLKQTPLTEDSAAQTDGQMVPLDNMDDVAVSMLVSNDGDIFIVEDEDVHLPSFRRSSHDSHILLQKETNNVLNDLSKPIEQISNELSEVHTQLGVCPGVVILPYGDDDDQTTSMTTPDSLHLHDSRPPPCDVSPAGEESDYYTPEDPNTTILGEKPAFGNHSNPSIRSIVIPEVIEANDSIDDDENQADDNEELGADSMEDEARGKALFRTMALDSISLPGTPQSQASTRSSGDSFSSSSSTRHLLPSNESPDVLAERDTSNSE